MKRSYLDCSNKIVFNKNGRSPSPKLKDEAPGQPTNNLNVNTT